ncbi:polysaccharide deacetylase family protein [Bifidobacterium sp.]|uniref:polysaccharide deacetylase family protein n=1 Tax=Bifidobacterium sp. TaxID=41200 RepID=UPI0039E74682
MGRLKWNKDGGDPTPDANSPKMPEARASQGSTEHGEPSRVTASLRPPRPPQPASTHPAPRKAGAAQERPRSMSDDETGRQAGVAGHQGNRHAFMAAVLLLFVCLIASAVGGTWYWWNNFRQFTVSINNETLHVTGRDSLSSILEGHHYFGKRPGALLSISGKHLKAEGGQAVRITCNGSPLSSAESKSTRLASDDVVTVSDGGNRTEGHAVKERTIPYSASMKLGGAVQFVSQQGSDGEMEYWVGSISHESVDKRVIRQPRNLEIDSINPKPPAGKKVIALTFDDGPSEYSSQILQILKGKGAKATFMDIGDQSVAMPQVERQMISDGNQVVSHSDSHPDLTTLNHDELRKELTSGFDALRKASGSTTRMLRAPYGSFNEKTWLQTSDIVGSNVLWTIDTQDWKQPGEDAIRQQVLSNAYSGAIVLMHDGGGNRTQDVHVLPGIIDALKSQGYQFVTVNELISMDSRFPSWVQKDEVAPSDAH